MKVREIMQSEVITENPASTLQEVCEAMRNSNVGWVPIVEDDGANRHTLVGVITDRDLLMRISSGKSLQTHVSGCMTRAVATVKPEDNVETAIDRMATEQVRRIPVVNDKLGLLGVVTLADIVRSNAVSPERLSETWRSIYAPDNTARLDGDAGAKAA